jgi:hypothetical protein
VFGIKMLPGSLRCAVVLFPQLEQLLSEWIFFGGEERTSNDKSKDAIRGFFPFDKLRVRMTSNRKGDGS